jgi:exodeoxyribonuclease VII large subunit
MPGQAVETMSAPDSPPGQPWVWGVSALLLAARDALTRRFGAVVVRGELVGFTRAASGHCYFSLKDADGAAATVRCALFRRAAALLDFAPADGHQVELRGRIEVYEARGELQLVVEGMRRLGAGSLYEQFLRLRARLEAQGLFDPARRRPVSREPRVVAVVTSLAAAALHDVLTALARRAPHVHVRVLPCLVQGAEAPPSIVQALQQVQRDTIDTVLLVRGGGSLEDLWAFNDERVVRAIVACPVPVVVGVGHETDVTLADLAADLRAPTPTAAAELACPAREERLAALDGAASRLRAGLRRALEQRAQRLDRAALRLAAPSVRLSGQRQRHQGLAHRMQTAVGRALQGDRQNVAAIAQRLGRAVELRAQREARKLDRLEGALSGVDPQAVLRRGYAWVEDGAGQPLLSVADLQTGQSITAVWSDGRAHAVVREIERIDARTGEAPA